MSSPARIYADAIERRYNMIPVNKILEAMDCFSLENVDMPMSVSDCKAKDCAFLGDHPFSSSTRCQLDIIREAEKVIRKQRRQLKSMRYRLYGRR